MRTLRRFTSRFATPGAAFQSSIGESVIDHLLNGAAEPLVRRTARKDDVALAQRQPLRVLLAEDNASTRGSASRRNSS
jgi:hypothetical protein